MSWRKYETKKPVECPVFPSKTIGSYSCTNGCALHLQHDIPGKRVLCDNEYTRTSCKNCPLRYSCFREWQSLECRIARASL